jgi:hypothetical protein
MTPVIITSLFYLERSRVMTCPSIRRQGTYYVACQRAPGWFLAEKTLTGWVFVAGPFLTMQDAFNQP